MLLLLQYLDFNNLQRSLTAFELECAENGNPIASFDGKKPLGNQKLQAAQVGLHYRFYDQSIKFLLRYKI